MTRLRCTATQQLAMWCEGTSVHRIKEDGGGCCCPDFSCCDPSLAVSLEERLAFTAANEEVRCRFLSSYLQRAADRLADDLGQPRVTPLFVAVPTGGEGPLS